MQLPDSPRFHVIDAAQVLPRYGHLAPRPIYVYLPVAAEQDRRRRFPVLYCQDGQNLWDDPHCCFGHGGWYLNRIVDELTDDNRIEPLILVGIPNSTQRWRDYTPARAYENILEHPYANFVCDVVKRYVDKNFPTKKSRAQTGVLGSSLGGLVSLMMAHGMPETFSKVACLSGSFEVKDRGGKSFLDFARAREWQDLKIYLDAGTVRDGAAWTRKMRDVYLAAGWKMGEDLLHFEDVGGEHNERCWRDRVWRALIFLFGRAGGRRE